MGLRLRVPEQVFLESWTALGHTVVSAFRDGMLQGREVLPIKTKPWKCWVQSKKRS